MKKASFHIFFVVMLVMLASSVVRAAERGDRIPFRSEVLAGYEEDDVKSRCDAADLQPIEGIWYYPDEKMTVVIERCSDAVTAMIADYRIVLVSAADMSLLPGTVIGYCVQSGARDKFRMWLYCEQDYDILENPQMCVATFKEDSGELLVERSEVKVKVRINFSRFLPQLFRGISIVPTKKEVEVPEGFRKVYPAIEDEKVRYL